MKNQNISNEVVKPSGKKLLLSTLLALAGAAILLVLIVLPAEYGIDPTGLGNKLGLAALNAPVKTIQISDVTGGNEALREVAIPDAGDPTPLPNPAVFQDEQQPPKTDTIQITIPSEAETEIKLKLQEGKSAQFSWQVDRGDLYVDFHGHDPSFGPAFFVRYKEEQESAGGNGSLVAPFTGEHGWYWLNYNEFPVVVTITVSGYYEEVIDYGLL